MSLKVLNGLKTPQSYIDATFEEKAKIINKCGPGGVINHLVPNNLLGLDITDSCNIHDWMFVEAKNQTQHKDSDFVFLRNMQSQVKKEQANIVLKLLRYGLTYFYFGAVRLYSFLTKNTSQSSVKVVRK